LVGLLLLLAVALVLVNLLDQAARPAAWSDRRAAAWPGIADGHQRPGALRPGFALLPGSLQLLVLWKPIALGLRTTVADVDLAVGRARTRVCSIDRDHARPLREGRGL